MAYRRRYRMTVPRRTYRRSRFNRYSRTYRHNRLAALQQRDVARFTLKVRRVLELQMAAGASEQTGFINIWKVLAIDPQFTALKTLYDQVRIAGVSVSAYSTFDGLANYPRSIFVHCWDRNGQELSGTQSDRFTMISSYGSSKQG